MVKRWRCWMGGEVRHRFLSVVGLDCFTIKEVGCSFEGIFDQKRKCMKVYSCCCKAPFKEKGEPAASGFANLIYQLSSLLSFAAKCSGFPSMYKLKMP